MLTLEEKLAAIETYLDVRSREGISEAFAILVAIKAIDESTRPELALRHAKLLRRWADEAPLHVTPKPPDALDRIRRDADAIERWAIQQLGAAKGTALLAALEVLRKSGQKADQ